MSVALTIASGRVRTRPAGSSGTAGILSKTRRPLSFSTRILSGFQPAIEEERMTYDLPAASSGQAWYREYLTSPHWLKLRDEKIAAADAQCASCGIFAKRGPDGLIMGVHVHHLTYERCPNNELLDDLVVLCIACHQIEHGRAQDTEAHREKVQRRVARRMERVVMEPIELAAYEEDEAEKRL